MTCGNVGDLSIVACPGDSHPYCEGDISRVPVMLHPTRD